MKAILALDSFKGSCSSHDAGEAVKVGILRADPTAVVETISVADGGEGTVEAIIAHGRGRWVPVTVMGPLGAPVAAGYGVLHGHTAVLEVSAASGLTLVPHDQLNPLLATTYGTGQLFLHALDAGYRTFLIGLGGSATNDGGVGFAKALGASFTDAEGHELPHGGAALSQLAHIDITKIEPRLRECTVVCAVDVTNPLAGPHGASAIYGPQKGATPEMVDILDNALSHYADIMQAQLHIDVRDLPGSGAAGGLGAGLYAFCGASFQPGIAAVLTIVGFDALLPGADFVITGEGRMDAQTLSGKVPIGIAQRVKAFAPIPVFALVGAMGQGIEAVYDAGIDAVFAIADRPMSYKESIQEVRPLLSRAGEALARTVMACKGGNRHAGIGCQCGQYVAQV